MTREEMEAILSAHKDTCEKCSAAQEPEKMCGAGQNWLKVMDREAIVR